MDSADCIRRCEPLGDLDHLNQESRHENQNPVRTLPSVFFPTSVSGRKFTSCILTVKGFPCEN
jgi:hypothetical protein